MSRMTGAADTALRPRPADTSRPHGAAVIREMGLLAGLELSQAEQFADQIIGEDRGLAEAMPSAWWAKKFDAAKRTLEALKVYQNPGHPQVSRPDIAKTYYEDKSYRDAVEGQHLGRWLKGAVQTGADQLNSPEMPWNNPDTTQAALDTLALPAKGAVAMVEGLGERATEAAAGAREAFETGDMAAADPVTDLTAEALLLGAGRGLGTVGKKPLSPEQINLRDYRLGQAAGRLDPRAPHARRAPPFYRRDVTPSQAATPRPPLLLEGPPPRAPLTGVLAGGPGGIFKRVAKEAGGPPSRGVVNMRTAAMARGNDIRAASQRSGVPESTIKRAVERVEEGVGRNTPEPFGRGDAVPPDHINTPRKLAAWRNRMVGLAQEGERNRWWYPHNTYALEARIDPSHMDPNLKTFAATSSETPVLSNAEFTTRLHNQAMAGYPMKAGMRPVLMSEQARKAYAGEEVKLGRKHRDYYAAHMSYLNDKVLQGWTNDFWNMTAMEYPHAPGKQVWQGTPTTGQHNFVRQEAPRLLEKLNASSDLPWSLDQAQAAIWAAIRARTNGLSVEDANVSMVDGLKRQMGQSVQESVHGRSTGSRMLDRPWEEKQAFHDEIQAVRRDAQGRDLVDLRLGLLTEPGSPVTGVFEGGLNPATTSPVALGGTASRRMDPASRMLWETSALIKGMLDRQDMVAGVKPYYLKNLSGPKTNFVGFELGRPFSKKETAAVTTALKKRIGSDSIMPIGTEQGAWFHNYDGSGLTNLQFKEHTQRALEDVFGGGSGRGWFATSDGYAAFNDWGVKPNGADYMGQLAGRPPHLQRAASELFAELGPKIAKVEDGWINRGWDINTNTRFWESPAFQGIGSGNPFMPPILSPEGIFSRNPEQFSLSGGNIFTPPLSRPN